MLGVCEHCHGWTKVRQLVDAMGSRGYRSSQICEDLEACWETWDRQHGLKSTTPGGTDRASSDKERRALNAPPS